MTVFLGLLISCCSEFALGSFDQGLKLCFSMWEGGGKGPASVYEWLSVRRGVWLDVVLIARELWMAFLRV